MQVKISIKGLALCYNKDDFWNVVFICDDVHPLHFKATGAAGPVPAKLHRNGMDRSIFFDIGTSPVTPPAKGAQFNSIFNMAAGYAHGPDKLSLERSGTTDVVWMRVPSATLDAEQLTERKYFVQEAVFLGYPVLVIDRIASLVTAEFELTEDSALTMSIEDDDGKTEISFPDSDTAATLEFDNDCGDHCRENDFIQLYDWVQSSEGKRFVAGQILNSDLIDFNDPAQIENFNGDANIESVKHGNCDPAVIDPPPND